MSMRSFFLLSLFSFLFFNSISAQEAANVKVEATSEELIISYDLMGREATSYEVKIFILDETGNRIEPQTLNGDIGSVVSGENKRIVWNVYEDVETLSGSIRPEIIVRAIEEKPTQILPTPEPPKLVEDVFVEEVPGRKTKSRRVKAGTKFALGSSSVVQKTNAFEKMFSWEGGLFLRWNALRKIYLQPELLYHRQAYEIINSETSRSETIHHFARAQGIVGFSPFGGGLYVHGGPYYGYRITSKQSITDEDKETIEIIEYPEMHGLKSPFHNSDYGYILGGNLNFGKGSFALGVQYSGSLKYAENEAYYNFLADIEHVNYSSFLFYFQKSF